LNEFIAELLRTPIHNERYTANFIRTGTRTGEVLFRDRFSDRLASAEWEVCFEKREVCVILKYNHRLVLLRSNGQEFRDRIDQTMLIF
jgi:hypothetical protein